MFVTNTSAQTPKHEIRAVWLTTIQNLDWPRSHSAYRQKQELIDILNQLQRANINTVLVQARVRASTIFPSTMEPWDVCMTGTAGQNPGYDALQFCIDECHKRGMECHAWIVTIPVGKWHTDGCKKIRARYPKLIKKVGEEGYMDPEQGFTGDYLAQFCRDVTRRYDVDGIHMDDYFYPYPVKGEGIPDDELFYDNSNGLKNQNDWRRYNVNLFIEQFYKTVHTAKPWVKVGISPFGIYRNKRNSEIGSNTNGLQNYDDLYADILLWVNNGWLDYCVPQIYWEIGNKAADYDTLIHWWNQYASARPLVIGEDVERTVKYRDPKNPNVHQLSAKMALHQQLPNVQGSVLWYAKAVVDNVGNYGTSLRQTYWRYPALQPAMPFIDDKAPGKVRKMKPIWTSDGYVLFWTAPKGDDWNDQAVKYVVYRFGAKEKIDTNDPSKICAITTQPFYKLPYVDGKEKWVYVVTALDRLQNESKAVKKKIKL